MSNSKEKDSSFGLGGIFKGIGNLIDLLSEMVEKGETETVRTGELKGKGKLKDLKGVYGVSVKFGLGGPTVESFGNIKETAKGPIVEEAREPLVDIFDEKEFIRVIVELPGIEENEIKLELKDDILILEAGEKDMKYKKEILLPVKTKIEALSKSYKNGILEINIKK